MVELQIAAHYRARAREMREAARLEEDDTAATLLSIAGGFDYLADQVLRKVSAGVIVLPLHT